MVKGRNEELEKMCVKYLSGSSWTVKNDIVADVLNLDENSRKFFHSVYE